MPRPITVLDDAVLRQLLNRFLPLDPADYPDSLCELTPEQLILRDLEDVEEATPAESGPALILETLEPRHPAQ